MEYPWTWTFERHRIRFAIDPDNEIAESESRNNAIDIFTDAITVGLYVERGYWDRMLEILPGIGIGCATFDDWAQKRIRQFNEMAAMAVSEDAPGGVIDRWRIDEIVIVDDEALPLVDPGYEGRTGPPSAWPALFPNVADRSVDMVWGFPANHASYILADWHALLYDSFLHELGHARYLVDVYAWRIDTGSGDRFPFAAPNEFGTIYFTTHEWGLMHQHYGFDDGRLRLLRRPTLRHGLLRSRRRGSTTPSRRPAA